MIRTLTFFGLLAASTAAFAGNAPRSQAVLVDDLDLATPVGRAQLDQRIVRAASAVCGAKLAGNAIRNAAIDECRTATLARSREQAAAVIAARAPISVLAVVAH
jgi:UrcA family protein